MTRGTLIRAERRDARAGDVASGIGLRPLTLAREGFAGTRVVSARKTTALEMWRRLGQSQDCCEEDEDD